MAALHLKMRPCKAMVKVNLQQLENIILFKKPVWYYPIGTKNPGHAKNEESTSHQLTIARRKMRASPKVGTFLN